MAGWLGSDGAPRRRRQVRRLSIDTRRRFGDGLQSAYTVAVPDNREPYCSSTAAAYLSSQRERRVRKGDVFVARCMVVFLASLASVFASAQYSHTYYVSWVATFAAFFLMLPSVLPSDNSRIRGVLLISMVNCAVVAVGTALKARGCWRSIRRGVCQLVKRTTTAACAWDCVYWTSHCLFAVALIGIWAHAVRKLTPCDALNRFWRVSGTYFLAVALLSLPDKAMSPVYWAGDDRATRVFRWNMLLTAEEFLAACLLLNSRFKLWIWRWSASYASITVSPTTKNHNPPFLTRLRRLFSRPDRPGPPSPTSASSDASSDKTDCRVPGPHLPR